MSCVGCLTVAFLRQVSALAIFIIVVTTQVSAQNGQSELLGVNGDGGSLQAALVDGKLSYAHINSIGGTLKFASLNSNGWFEQILATGLSHDSSLALQVSPNGVAHIAVLNGGSGALNFYTRASNGAWSSEVVKANDTKGKPSLYVGPNEILISFFSNSSGDLLLARRAAGSWSITTIDAAPSVVGRESSIGVGLNSNVAVAYFDETNLKLKVAVSLDRTNWGISTLDYPGARYGRLPHLVWLPNNEISIVAGDVIQSQTVGGQGLIHAQRSSSGVWSFERIGHPAASSQIGRFVTSTYDRNMAMLVRNGGVSSIINAKRADNGLWGGTVAFVAPSGESLSELATILDSSNTLHYLSRSTIGDQTFIRRTYGVVITQTPSEPVPPTTQPTPTPTPTPTPSPTPEPRSGVDSDGDGLSDDEEHRIGTNPLLSDTDGDGSLDGQEILDKSDPQDANSFSGAIDNRICSFFRKRSGNSQRVSVHNLISSTLKYGIEIISLTGQLKGVDERAIEAHSTDTASIDKLVSSSGKLSRGQVCVRWVGRKSFITSKYSEVRSTASSKKRVSRKKRSSLKRSIKVILEHAMTNGEVGNQEIRFRAVQLRSGQRLTSGIDLQNISSNPMVGRLIGIDTKGKRTNNLKVTIRANSLISISPSKLKLRSTGKILWLPDTTTEGVRMVYEQELETRSGRSYLPVKISRSDGRRR